MTVCKTRRSADLVSFSCFFFNDTATTEIYTLSLHDALPISGDDVAAGEDAVDEELERHDDGVGDPVVGREQQPGADDGERSEEHTSELQSRQYLVCRLLLEKKIKIHDRTVTRLHSVHAHHTY